MIRLAVPIVILLLMLFAGAVWALFGYLNLPPTAGQPGVEAPRAATGEAPAPTAKAELPQAASPQGGAASFDVVRIDPNGTSVFAGRTEPHARVTIMGDGQPVGTAEADENGEWTFAVEHKFASADPKLALLVKPPSQPGQEAAPESDAAGTAQNAEAALKPEANEQKSAKAVTSHLLKDLEGMVEEARTAERGQVATAESPATLPADNAAPASVTAVHLSPSAQPSPGQPSVRKTIPVPITFVFNEATFTENGKKAATLLLEYLRLKHFKGVSLTGHADERGTEELNMNLSRERLDTVARYLRDGGFKGQLELIPKGESEPFAGVVRSEYNQEDLWQLDRRVELIISP